MACSTLPMFKTPTCKGKDVGSTARTSSNASALAHSNLALLPTFFLSHLAACDDAAYPTPYKADKKKAMSTYTVRSIEDIQRELMEKGSATVAMLVYEDFEMYVFEALRRSVFFCMSPSWCAWIERPPSRPAPPAPRSPAPNPGTWAGCTST